MPGDHVKLHVDLHQAFGSGRPVEQPVRFDFEDPAELDRFVFVELSFAAFDLAEQFVTEAREVERVGEGLALLVQLPVQKPGTPDASADRDVLGIQVHERHATAMT